MKRQWNKNYGRGLMADGQGKLMQRDPYPRPWEGSGKTKKSRPSIVKRIVQLFKRRLEPWELELKAEAVAKRARRRERNIRWWSNDRTWRVA